MFLFENILNLVGFVVGLAIGGMSFVGFKNTGSPTLFRLTLAFFAISIGFFVIWIGYVMDDFFFHEGRIEKWVQTLGIGIQTVGYFFIAFSHSIKSFFPKTRYFRSIIPVPLFLASSVHVENILRSVSFILLAYGAIETILSYFDSKNKGTILVSLGLACLALGEFLSWYSFVFPESILYSVAIAIKIGGLLLLFIPVSKIPFAKIKLGKEFDIGED